MEQPNKHINFMIREFMNPIWFPPDRDISSPVYKFDTEWSWILPVWKKLYIMSHSKVFKNDMDFRLLLSQAEHELIQVNLDEFVKKIVLCIEYYNSLT